MSLSTAFLRRAWAVLLAAGGPACLAQAQTTPPGWRWVSAATSTTPTYLSGLATDAAGNTYTASTLSAPVTLAPGTVLTPQGGMDGYVAKYATNGTLLWARQLMGSGNERIGRIVTDAAGNVYFTGSYSSSIQLGSLSLPSVNFSSAYVASLDVQGQPRWLRQVSTNGASTSNVALDAAGNLYLSGSFTQTVTLGTITLSSPNAVSILLAKFNPQGVVQWAQQGGSIPFVNSSVISFDHTLTVSPAGDAYLSWAIHPTAGGFGSLPPAAGYGDYDVTLVRYSPEGVPQWQKRYGTIALDYAGGTALDANGHLLAAMVFSTNSPATVDTYILSASGSSYGALLQLDAATGALQWVQKLQASSNVNFQAVAADAAGNAYVAGSFIGAMQAANQVLTSQGVDSDALVVSYSAQGTPRWFQQSAGPGAEGANFIALSSSNELSVGGYFFQQGQFGATPLMGNGATTAAGYVAQLNTLPTASTPARPLALGVYPNPATDQVHLPALAPGTRLELLDVLGRVARTATVSAAATLPVRGLAPGLYTLRAIDAQGRLFASRLIVD
jgi:hypothetical protein